MSSPEDRRYAQSHEWHKPEGDVVVVGVSKFAVDELTDITYLQINDQDKQVKAGESFGEIESVKATSELYSGIDGTVVEVNQAAIDDPSIINQDPYGAGWLIKVKPSDPAQLDALMGSDEYDQANG